MADTRNETMRENTRNLPGKHINKEKKQDSGVENPLSSSNVTGAWEGSVCACQEVFLELTNLKRKRTEPRLNPGAHKEYIQVGPGIDCT